MNIGENDPFIKTLEEILFAENILISVDQGGLD
jgi:hypothetical protein